MKCCNLEKEFVFLITLPSAGLYFDVSLTYIIEPRLKTGRNNKSRADQQLRGAARGRIEISFCPHAATKQPLTSQLVKSGVKLLLAAAILPYKASLEPSKVHSKLGALINELK